jgi:hypothetical protein
MERRKFLELAGLGLASSFVSSKLTSGSPVRTSSKAALPSQENAARAYGSGHFGKWISDSFGLPAYQYTCNQVTDPKAISAVDRAWRSPTDHTHQVGNNRLVAAVSNYGYVQVRQDEGSPKFLNDYCPQQDRYGAGIGFLADESIILSTYYPGTAQAFDRIFGMGYLRKRVTGQQYEIDQAIFAPFGDDPVLISQVTITMDRVLGLPQLSIFVSLVDGSGTLKRCDRSYPTPPQFLRSIRASVSGAERGQGIARNPIVSRPHAPRRRAMAESPGFAENESYWVLRRSRSPFGSKSRHGRSPSAIDVPRLARCSGRCVCHQRCRIL